MFVKQLYVNLNKFISLIGSFSLFFLLTCQSGDTYKQGQKRLLENCEEDAQQVLAKDIFDTTVFLSIPKIQQEQHALDAFFTALEKSAVVRIAHWGDSQIEGGRLTKEIRSYFQKLFGGRGIGFIPMVDITDPVSYRYVSSPNWMRYTFFHHRQQNSLYGPAGVSFQPMPHVVVLDSSLIKDSVRTETVTFTQGEIRFFLVPDYDQAVLWYGPVNHPCEVLLYTKDNQKPERLILDGNKHWNEIILPTLASQIILQFPLTCPLIYGLSFESTKGIIIDNFGIRGHSGDGLLLLSKDMLADYVKSKNVSLFILQFGANVTPYLRTKEDVHKAIVMYEKVMTRLQQSFPQVSMLFVGPGDMPVRGTTTSNPMLQVFNQELKNLAMTHSFAYFDVYAFMGGSGSLSDWVRKKLATEDGHFTQQGREVIAHEIVNELMHAYHLFLLRRAGL